MFSPIMIKPKIFKCYSNYSTKIPTTYLYKKNIL